MKRHVRVLLGALSQTLCAGDLEVTGHFSGKDGWERELLVRIPYAQLPEAEKVKDRPVWQAVRDVVKAATSQRDRRVR